MLIHEACKICRLTKKAIEYYEEQQLIQPHILNNGYRDFSDYEIEQLKKIAIMRKLELSISDIRQVLNDDTTTALYEISMKRAFKIDEMKAKQELTQQLIQQQDWDYTRLQLEFLEQKQTISQRLRNVFPGPYGNYVSLHFASYLQEPITSQIQQDAFETIVSFLDSCNFTISLELQDI